MEEGSEVSLLNACVPCSTKVGPLPETVLGNVKIWDLRKLKNVAIPDGIERIGNYLFWGSDVESVTIPASVKEIGEGTFCRCKKLKCVTFEEGSQLKKIGRKCFYEAGLKTLVLPGTLREIGSNAFENCENLKNVTFTPESRLERIGQSCFCGVVIKRITIPRGVTKI